MVSKPNESGKISLPGLFEGIASSLIGAAETGTLLKKTGNIADSGAPLEKAVRELFSSRLPNPFSVGSGYFFDQESQCSPQLDMMIFDADHAHELMRSPEGASYLPFSCVKNIAEMKASAYRFKAHLKQVGLCHSVHNKMMSKSASYTKNNDDLVSILFVARSPSLSTRVVRNAFKAATDMKPTFTILLDRATLITSQSPTLAIFFGEDAPLTMQSAGGSGEVCYFAPAEGPQARGRLLLWFFYAIVLKLVNSSLQQDIAFLNGLASQNTLGNDIFELGRARHPTEEFAMNVQRSFPLSNLGKISEKSTHLPPIIG